MQVNTWYIEFSFKSTGSVLQMWIRTQKIKLGELFVSWCTMIYVASISIKSSFDTILSLQFLWGKLCKPWYFSCWLKSSWFSKASMRVECGEHHAVKPTYRSCSRRGAELISSHYGRCWDVWRALRLTLNRVESDYTDVYTTNVLS